MTSKLERAVLAGGCFWGMQDLIRKLPGVVSHARRIHGRRCAERDLPQPWHARRGHRDRCSTRLGISYRDILEFFFQIHDPTTLNRQGNDVGTSAIARRSSMSSEAQRDEALRTIDDVERLGPVARQKSCHWRSHACG